MNLTDREKMLAEYFADGPTSEFPPGTLGALRAVRVPPRRALARRRRENLLRSRQRAARREHLRVGRQARTSTTSGRSRRSDSSTRANRPGLGGTGHRARSRCSARTGVRTSSERRSDAALSRVLLRSQRLQRDGRTDPCRVRRAATPSATRSRFAAGSSAAEPGIVPAADVTFSWATFSAAADDAGMSRRYGGIHFRSGDLAARAAGRALGAIVWQKAKSYIAYGSAVARRGGADPSRPCEAAGARPKADYSSSRK